jgi:very-short-patch-repair endonuclease
VKITYNKHLKELARELRNNPTKSEKLLWKYLKGDKMCGYDFHRQKPIGNFIYDFYCYELKLVIELDGYTHRFEEVIENDKSKDAYAEELGFTMLRFKDEQIFKDMNNVLLEIQHYIEQFEGHNGL